MDITLSTGVTLRWVPTPAGRLCSGCFFYDLMNERRVSSHEDLPEWVELERRTNALSNCPPGGQWQEAPNNHELPEE